ncbi:MAG: sigma-70 family RNA polymerase sigma factor [Syntrophaceae bacterium]|nr:sigma-70 family RNA polymerase sigma factor [Syntrophaceae bacterium]
MPDMSAQRDERNRIIEDDDAGFVARSRQGDTEAFAVLVRRHQKKMLNVAYRMIGDYDEACDVVQESFLSAYRAIGKFRGDARFSTWLCGIVLNHARNHLKQKNARSGNEEISLDEPAGASEETLLNTVRSGGESIIECLEKKELSANVQVCISALDGEQREVLVLRDIQEYSYAEIGVMLKLPEGTVKSRLFRARNALKESLLRIFGDLR